ncbi:MAG: ThuA domain-containing protein [Candidatus Glassbacteria bacterium]|nr:ThuA domain-containing protein [Candidatus Glassbacteria bacterium]
MKIWKNTIWALAGTLFLPFLAQPAPAAGKMDPFFREGALRVLILSGRNNHDWRTTTPYLKKLLLGTGRFDVRVNEEASGITAAALAPYDLLVLDYMGPRWGEEAETAVERFVKAGKGMVVVHGASYAFSGREILGDSHAGTGVFEPPWPEYARMVGGIWADSTAHGDRHLFEVRFTDREHPVAAGMGEGFMISDDLYHDQRMEPDAHVLATAFSDPATRGTGEDEPILWTVSYGDGRVFYTALGHDLNAMHAPGFVATFLRGCEWAAAGKVSLPPLIDPDSRAGDVPRVLVVTGGHEYDTEFYSVFDGDWLVWDHALSNHQAFGSEIRERYDVLVLYDMSAEISEQEKKNLRDFVEGGKGLVVLHHAIADYNSWEWWWREVVGGRYILPGGDQPASSYRHDVELSVRPRGSHPVTAGIGPLQIVDETYKDMWISPQVKVILETEDPTSDGPLAWVSPWQGSRVVYLQLGHDRQAHLHPAYRELVKRSVLWTAGKLE